MLGLSLSACNYSNQFQGTFNNTPSTMTAYSSNIDRYCVSLTINANGATKNSFISAQAVFDEKDLLKPMSFNTKGAECGANLDEYLVGTRTTTVVNTTNVTQSESAGVNLCQNVTYRDYHYQENIVLEMRNNVNDQTAGSFSGVGQVAEYVDFDHPVAYGPVYYCGPSNPYPYPYPHPGPGPYPGPYPHPGPGPYPHPHPGPGPHPHPGGPHHLDSDNE